jgi:hypothetical protein
VIRSLPRAAAWPLLVFWVCLVSGPMEAQGAEKAVIGWLERISITPDHLVLHAKMDTGADSCSLHVEDIEPFKRDGKKWVRFRVVNRTGEWILLERKVFRFVRIKSMGSESQRRHVVEMGICLGDTGKQVQVNLVDRSGFKFQMLVGRNFLKDSFIVDPSAQYTREPVCKGGPLQ